MLFGMASEMTDLLSKQAGNPAAGLNYVNAGGGRCSGSRGQIYCNASFSRLAGHGLGRQICSTYL
jgi:hypothetical protein